MQSRKNQNLWSGKSNPKTTFVFSLPELRSIAMNIIFSQSPSISYLKNISSSFSIPRFSMINFKLKYPHIPPRSQTSLPFFFSLTQKIDHDESKPMQNESSSILLHYPLHAVLEVFQKKKVLSSLKTKAPNSS